MTTNKLLRNKSFDVTLVIALLLAAWLVIGTGLASDDLALALTHRSSGSGTLLPTLHSVAFPVEHYTHTLAYHYLGTDFIWGYDALKAIYTMASLWMMARFFSLYLDPWRSSIAAFLFIFLPNHDATVFWFIGQYLMLSISSYCYGYYRIHCGKPASGIFFSTLASFISYGSTPIAAGLSLLALIEGRRKDALLIFAPNAIYILYYFVISIGFELGPQRLPSQLDVMALLKQFALQLLTFTDANFGPSFWLKASFAIGEISLPQTILGTIALAIVWTQWESAKHQTSKPLLFSLATVAVLALGTFALTGRYPQLAFNLGDRVTIYGSLLISYCLVCIFPNKFPSILMLALTLFSALGLSTHWKDWTTHQSNVITQIANNSSLRNFSSTTDLLVTGNQYSQLGPLSHLEFMSESYVVDTIFALALSRDKQFSASTLNRRHFVDGNNLRDRKYGESKPLPENVWIYDSQQDKLFKISRTDLNAHIGALPQDTRHWVQLLGSGWMLDATLQLMPRLKYAL